MARRYVQGVYVHVKVDMERCTVGVQEMGIFQRAENMKVRKTTRDPKDIREDDEVCRWKGLDRDSCASLQEVV
jgi:hypothetical protein